MKNNQKQIKDQNSSNLPIVSNNEDVQRNSMRLYVYLVSISSFNGRNKARTFSHKDFTVNKIKDILHMHPTTIKKYWKILEENGLIKYEGPIRLNLSWDDDFMQRKKDGATYYTIPKKEPYRIIPKETIDNIQKKWAVDELELKVYLLLAELQERFCYLSTPEREFSIKDLRELLKLSKNTINNKKISIALNWLCKLNLVDYKIIERKTNLGETFYSFLLNQVNYYTDGGEAKKYLNSESSVLSEEIKRDILEKEPLIKIVEF